jgi:ketosteroid isomerase-like protein
MIKAFSVVFIFIASISAFAQGDVAPLFQTHANFAKTAAERGMKAAFLEFLGDDATVFLPGALNGKQYWNGRDDDLSTTLVRGLTYSDISANGLLGYTTGNWRTYQKGKSEGLAKFGQYVTIWEKKPDGKFRASLDIVVSHEKLPFAETDTPIRSKQSRDLNKRSRSPVDASMDFLRASMTNERLGGAYKKFAADDVRLLRDAAPPIIGKKRVVEEMNEYVSVEFPTKVALFQAADMAYTWNACQFDNSNEGKVRGNCVHIWKLREKKWWIVLGVFAPVPNDTPPVLRMQTKKKS